MMVGMMWMGDAGALWRGHEWPSSGGWWESGGWRGGEGKAWASAWMDAWAAAAVDPGASPETATTHTHRVLSLWITVAVVPSKHPQSEYLVLNTLAPGAVWLTCTCSTNGRIESAYGRRQPQRQIRAAGCGVNRSPYKRGNKCSGYYFHTV